MTPQREAYRADLRVLGDVIEWRRQLEVEPPRAIYATSGFFVVLPIVVPSIAAMKAPNMQNIPRSRR